MRFDVECAMCMDENKENKVTFEVSNKSLYRVKCSEGHEYDHVLSVELFEMLYEVGIYALIDGYTREAVSSFATALERFHQYCFKFLSKYHSVPSAVLDGIWETMNRSSEQQAGAFHSLYMVTFKEEPPKIKGSKKQLRNDVIHYGKIPSQEQATNYAKFVFEYIRDILDKFSKYENFNVIRMSIMYDYFTSQQEFSTSSSRITMMGISLYGVVTEKDFNKSLDTMIQSNSRWIYT
ncbi:hypothetical protein [Terribacillus saccharophilus]|uniref:hypothetical protein n=1 Tax=Terribacillus saccharophilus TaxID=361277 RepID=UPI003982C8E8